MRGTDSRRRGLTYHIALHGQDVKVVEEIVGIVADATQRMHLLHRTAGAEGATVSIGDACVASVLHI